MKNATSSEERVARQPKMNVKLLRRIQKHILAEPRRLRMSIFGKKVDPLDSPLNPPCGTTACIAGWARILTEDDAFGGERYLGLSSSLSRGRMAIGIDHFQATKLFYEDSWPKRFILAHQNAKTPRGRASAAVRRIDHFIKTNGAE